ncbi:hypothetical protein DFH08DRAFT_820877 [Mycena albidolilacea]|uniref:Uncharacterized protein n=1 Tax=Mycena albidolilacea TaxID=1033008 RepID=A0AAD6ZB54_9AGAR|nr:hypothetical protein DFH08DRAFT_820877 [Mycena albidolilacea]
MSSEIAGFVPSSMLDNIRKFLETLHKIQAFVQGQLHGNKIKQLFRINGMNNLLKDCYAGLDEVKEVFGITAASMTSNDIQEMKKTTKLMHQELVELIQGLSDSSTISDQSSVYMTENESNNRFTLIFNFAPNTQDLSWL